MRQTSILGALLVVAVVGACAGSPSLPSPSLPAQSASAVASSPSDSPRATATPIPIVSGEPFAAGEATCQNEAQGYAVSYPADWTVAPADPEREFGACQYFGPGPFDLDFSDGEGDGHTIDIGAGYADVLRAHSPSAPRDALHGPLWAILALTAFVAKEPQFLLLMRS